jgi:hypothetical protein
LRPAILWAVAEAGITPLLMTIASAFMPAPAAISGTPGSLRLDHRNNPMNT